MKQADQTHLLLAGFGTFLLVWGAILRVEVVHDAVLRSWLVGAPLVLFAILVVRRLWLADHLENPVRRKVHLLRSAALRSFVMLSMLMYLRSVDLPLGADNLFHRDSESYADVLNLYGLVMTLEFPLMTLAFYWISLWEQNREARRADSGEGRVQTPD